MGPPPNFTGKSMLVICLARVRIPPGLPTNPSQGGVKFYTIQQYSSYVIFAQQWEAFD